MVRSKDETGNSRQEHEAIRAQLKFLTRALADLAARPTANLTSQQVSELISSYRLGLCDFRDGLVRHCQLDEIVFEKLGDMHSVHELKEEHSLFLKRVDDAIRLAHSSERKGLTAERLRRIAQRIDQTVTSTCKSMLDHMEKEDSILEREEQRTR